MADGNSEHKAPAAEPAEAAKAIVPDSKLVDHWIPSPNFGPRLGVTRPDMLILHYTDMVEADKVLRWLCMERSQVSCHYFVDLDGRIVQMVREAERAWHAGASHWQGESDNNSRAIGIEIHNAGHERGYPDFPEPQMRAVEALCIDIVKRNAILRERVLAHSDIAPLRKIDPGEKFDWQRLARAGVGIWVEAEPVRGDPGLGVGDQGEEVIALKRRLSELGYGIEMSDVYDVASEKVVAAFQRHWRQAKVDGRADASTLATLERLLAKRPRRA